MRKRIIMILLGLGAVGGFASGIAHMRCGHHHRMQAFERHVAQVCVDAARNATDSR